MSGQDHLSPRQFSQLPQAGKADDAGVYQRAALEDYVGGVDEEISALSEDLGGWDPMQIPGLPQPPRWRNQLRWAGRMDDLTNVPDAASWGDTRIRPHTRN